LVVSGFKVAFGRVLIESMRVAVASHALRVHAGFFYAGKM
jgi:hypothetical protein